MYIEIETTPNPSTLKFLAGKPLLAVGETLDVPDIETAQTHSPLAASLFKINNVEAVFIGYDFISVRKSDAISWDMLKPQVLGMLMERLLDGTPLKNQDMASENQQPTENYDKADEEIVVQIKELLDERVRPAVAADGGDIIFHGFDKGIVYLAMQGACAGCPSSTATLKMGIENMLRHYIPDVREVRPIE